MAPNRRAEPSNSGQMESATQLHIFGSFTSGPRGNYKTTSANIFKFSFSKIYKPLPWVKIIVVFVAIVECLCIIAGPQEQSSEGLVLSGPWPRGRTCLLVGASAPWRFLRPGRPPPALCNAVCTFQGSPTGRMMHLVGGTYCKFKFKHLCRIFLLLHEFFHFFVRFYFLPARGRTWLN